MVERLRALIAAMEAKRDQEKTRISKDERQEFVNACNWYIEGVRDAILVVDGGKPAQVRLPPDANSTS